jgi:tripartite-type tricarboxylate transporter receptor subunit TctC
MPQQNLQRPAARRITQALALACATTCLALPLSAQADTWPSKPVKVIVNFPAGGVADQIARAVTQPLQVALGQPVVIENKGGAGGNIGGDAAAKAPADGYTLLLSSGGMVSVNPHLYPKMSFDPVKDLTPVAAAARVLVYLEVKPSLPVNTVQEFLAYLKANPGKVTYGSPGNGSSPHLASEMLKSQANVFAVHVPYRGAAPAMQDLLGGQVDFMFDPGIGLQHVQAKKLKLLAVGSSKRSPLYPDVPTLDEVGLKGFDADTLFGFYAPAGTPPDIVNRLNREINKALDNPAVQERIKALGGVPATMSPQDFNARALSDSKRFGALIKERKIIAD